MVSRTRIWHNGVGSKGQQYRLESCGLLSTDIRRTRLNCRNQALALRTRSMSEMAIFRQQCADSGGNLPTATVAILVSSFSFVSVDNGKPPLRAKNIAAWTTTISLR